MEDKLVTLAILTYAKAQILKNVLENEGIETYIHNVNQIQPVVSSGVHRQDLPQVAHHARHFMLAEDQKREQPLAERTHRADEDDHSNINIGIHSTRTFPSRRP